MSPHGDKQAEHKEDHGESHGVSHHEHHAHKFYEHPGKIIKWLK